MPDYFLGPRLQSLDTRAQEDLFDSRLSESITLGDQFGSAGATFGLNAPGSLKDDRRAVQVATEQGRQDELGFFQRLSGIGLPDQRSGKPVSREEFETSEYARSGVDYAEGDTDVSLSIKKRIRDEERRAAVIANARSGVLSTSTTVLGAIAGSVIDPKNLASGIVAGGGVGLAARGTLKARAASRNLDRAFDAFKKSPTARVGGAALARLPGGKRTAALAGVDVAATIPSVATGLGNQKFTDREYTLADASLDLVASVVLGRLLEQALPAGIKRVASSIPAREKAEITRVAMSQFEAGQTINVEPLINLSVSEELTSFTTIRAEDATPTIRQAEDGTFEARFPQDQGVMAEAVGRGRSAEEAEANLLQKFSNPRLASEDTGVSAAVLREMKESSDMSRPIQSIEDFTGKQISELRDAAKRAGLDVDKLDERISKLAVAQLREKRARENLGADPDSAEAQKELRNARKAAKRAKDRANELLKGEFSPALAGVDFNRVGRQDLANRAQARATRLFREENDPVLDSFITAQVLDPASPEARHLSDNPFVQNFRPQEVRARADRAPAPGERVTADTRALADQRILQLREELDSPLVSDAEKLEIRGALDDLDAREQEIPMMRALKTCFGGSN